MLTKTETKIQNILDILRIHRNFNVDEYIKLKVDKINKFFEENKLDAAVIGVSGGVDSAVAYRLLVEASKQPYSPIKKIVAVAMPIYCEGTTGQNPATLRASRSVSINSTCEFYVDDLTNACKAYLEQVRNGGDDIKYKASDWTIGQLASIVRTPNLYFRAAYLQQFGFKSIVVGTTNRDEGSYIGFFGKASDAMVDLQPIADIHKSEVYQVAEKLNVPTEIIDEKPKGDVYDGRCDEDMIGSPYWFLEMYLLWLSFAPGNQRESNRLLNLMRELPEDEQKLFNEYQEAIELIHEKNLHKYRVGNPAHFIDVMERKVPGGWQ